MLPCFAHPDSRETRIIFFIPFRHWVVRFEIREKAGR
jgi:hypothetical protein